MARTTLDRTDGIATLWLDRADKRNAIDAEMMRELGAAFDAVGADRTVRVLIIRGRGTVFSSGIDHSLLAGVMHETAKTPFLHLQHDLQETFHKLGRLHQPVIAALHGACIGMALEMSLAVDIRVASEDCVFGLPEIAFGLVPDVGGTTRLVRAVGEPRAREMIMTGRMVKARTAERYGLIHEVVAADALDARIAARASQLAQLSPQALSFAKQLSQASADAGAGTSFRLEGIVQEALIAQPDLAQRFPAAVAFIKAAVAAAD